MLRVIGLTLVMVTGAAKFAHAETRYDSPGGSNFETTSLQHAQDTRHAALNSSSPVQLQIGGGLGFSVPTHDSRGSGHLDLARTERQQRGREGRRLTRSRNAHGRSESWLNFAASSKPTLAYAVNDSLSLGLNYRYQNNESFDFKAAKVGGIDPNFHSHNFMIEAHWQF